MLHSLKKNYSLNFFVQSLCKWLITHEIRGRSAFTGRGFYPLQTCMQMIPMIYTYTPMKTEGAEMCHFRGEVREDPLDYCLQKVLVESLTDWSSLFKHTMWAAMPRKAQTSSTVPNDRSYGNGNDFSLLSIVSYMLLESCKCQIFYKSLLSHAHTFVQRKVCSHEFHWPRAFHQNTATYSQL